MDFDQYINRHQSIHITISIFFYMFAIALSIIVYRFKNSIVFLLLLLLVLINSTEEQMRKRTAVPCGVCVFKKIYFLESYGFALKPTYRLFLRTLKPPSGDA